MKTGLELIAAERLRQIDDEMWTPEHDDEHEFCELAWAAVCYATPAKHRETFLQTDSDGTPMEWPWRKLWWKPSDRIRDLAKAGALIAAEIDRLQRQEK